MSEGQDYFTGQSQTQTSSIFARIEPGQMARGFYLSTVKGHGDMEDQALIFSPKAGRCFLWPGHYTLNQALATLPRYTPVVINRGRDGKGPKFVKNYAVTSYPVVPESDTATRGKFDVSEKAALAEIAKIRGATGSAAPAPHVSAGPEPQDTGDDDLPF